MKLHTISVDVNRFVPDCVGRKNCEPTRALTLHVQSDNNLSLAHVRSRDNANEVGISNKWGVVNLMLAIATAFVNEIHPKFSLAESVVHFRLIFRRISNANQHAVSTNNSLQMTNTLPAFAAPTNQVSPRTYLQEDQERKNMKRINHVMAMVLVGIAGLALFNGCGPKRALTISADVDGSDVVKVSGNKLWIEHEDFQLPQRIILNDKVWVPQWTTNVSAPFVGLQPPFAPRDPLKIKVSKKAGRGNVIITQRPSAENDQTLGIRIDDNEQGGADRYTIRVTW
jgi:hypothetical protein